MQLLSRRGLEAGESFNDGFNDHLFDAIAERHANLDAKAWTARLAKLRPSLAARRIQIVEVVGAGSAGPVLRVEHHRLGPCCMKITLCRTEEERRGLVREVSAMNRVASPHLVTAKSEEPHFIDEVGWFLMEFVEGVTARRRLDQYPQGVLEVEVGVRRRTCLQEGRYRQAKGDKSLEGECSERA